MAIPVAFRTKAEGAVNSTSVSGTLDIDIGSGNNRLVIIAVGRQVDEQVTNVTVDGVNSTLLHRVLTSENGSCPTLSEVWYMLDTDLPASTGNITVTATGTTSANFLLAASLYTGIKQQVAEALGKAVRTSEQEDFSVGVTSVTANALGFVASLYGCGAGFLDTPGTGFTFLDNQDLGATGMGTSYDLDIGTAGAKTFDMTSALGNAFVLGSAWEIDTLEPPAGADNSGAIMHGANF